MDLKFAQDKTRNTEEKQDNQKQILIITLADNILLHAKRKAMRTNSTEITL